MSPLTNPGRFTTLSSEHLKRVGLSALTVAPDRSAQSF